MNSAALFNPFFFFDLDFDFLCFFLRCDSDLLLELDRPREEEEDDDELEDDDVDLNEKISGMSSSVKTCQHYSMKTCFFFSKFSSQDLLNYCVHFWILPRLLSPFSSPQMSFFSFLTPYSCSCFGFFWASLPCMWARVNTVGAVYAAVQTVLLRFGLVFTLLCRPSLCLKKCSVFEQMASNVFVRLNF